MPAYCMGYFMAYDSCKFIYGIKGSDKSSIDKNIGSRTCKSIKYSIINKVE